jgi:phosphoribosylformimino-5-aminoimidazole carboxamide ribotide isomerase
MIAIPAIDIRDGCCVQLVGGSFENESIRIADALGVARRWRDAGFQRLHVVDLDGAMSTGSNNATVRALASMPDVMTQVGGGVRSTEEIDALFGQGAARVIVGTRAIKDRDWLACVADRWPGRIIVAADARHGAALTDGWTATLGVPVVDVIASLGALPLAAVLVTAVDREGRLGGPDVDLMTRVAAATTHPVIASGGVGTMHDLEQLAATGVAAAVIGMALYSGALDATTVAREFAT